MTDTNNTSNDNDNESDNTSARDNRNNRNASSLLSVSSFVLANTLTDPHRYWRTLPNCYKNSKTFVLKLLQHAKTLPSKNDLERTWSQKLRWDRDVVLSFCNRDDFLQLYTSRQLYIPPHLLNDKAVVMAYVAKIPRALQEASERLTDDRDVVKLAVQRDGRELQYASWRLQTDKEMVGLAIQNHGLALQFCPFSCPTRDHCLNDRNSMKMVLSNGGGAMYRDIVNPILKNDVELITLALCNGLNYRFVPQAFKQNITFCQDLLAANSSLLHPVLAGYAKQDDQHQLACAALLAPDLNQARFDEILAMIGTTTLRKTRPTHAMVVALCTFASKTIVHQYLHSQHRLSLLSRDSLIVALQTCHRVLYSQLSPAWQMDPELVLAAIQPDTALWMLRRHSRQWLSQHPAVCVKAVTVIDSIDPEEDVAELQLVIPPILFRNHVPLQVVWMRKFGFLECLSPQLSNPDFCLNVLAECCPSALSRCTNTLRGDLAFMKRAVQTNGTLLPYAAPGIQNDPELQCLAVSKFPRAVTDANQRRRLLAFVTAKLRLRDTFLALLQGTEDTLRSTLSVLNVLGDDASLHFKQIIAECLGVPTGGELERLLQCQRNLELPPPPPPRAVGRTMEAAANNNDRMIRRRQALRRQILLEWMINDDDDDDNVPPLRRRHRAANMDPQRPGAGPPLRNNVLEDMAPLHDVARDLNAARMRHMAQPPMVDLPRQQLLMEDMAPLHDVARDLNAARMRHMAQPPMVDLPRQQLLMEDMAPLHDVARDLNAARMRHMAQPPMVDLPRQQLLMEDMAPLHDVARDLNAARMRHMAQPPMVDLPRQQLLMEEDDDMEDDLPFEI